MPTPLISIVGAEKGGVGKTTFSNVLLGYFDERGIQCRAWDSESPKGNLKRSFPNRAEVVDLETVDGQVAVFDTLQQSPATLIDMRAGILTDTVSLLHTLGCVRLAEQGLIRLALFHMIGNSVASFQELADIAKSLGSGVKHFVVVNHHTNDASFFEHIDGVSKDVLNGSIVINVPKLATRAMEFVDEAAMPFREFGRDPNRSFTGRGFVNAWLEKIYPQLDNASFRM